MMQVTAEIVRQLRDRRQTWADDGSKTASATLSITTAFPTTPTSWASGGSVQRRRRRRRNELPSWVRATQAVAVKSVSPPEFRTCERPFCARSVHDFGLYKTVICKYWELKIACPKGTRCTYAHGPKELRPHVSSHAKETSPRRKDHRELVAVSEHAHQKRRASRVRNKSNRSLSPTETRSHDEERRRLGGEFRYRARSNSPSALMTHSSAAPATIRKRRRSIDLPWGRGLRNISKKRRKRRLSASSTGSGSSGLAGTDPRRRDRSFSNDDDFDDDDHIMFSFVEPIVEDKDDSVAGDQDEDPYSPLYSPFSIIETDSEPTPQSRERSTVSPFLERVCRPRSPLAPMSSVVPVQIQALFPPLAPTETASASAHAPAPAVPLPPAPAPQPRPASPVVIENRLVPLDRDYFRTYFAELARRKKTVRPIL
ncbi:BQ5605_C001g00220 [Microbotryum silenes-dioicae]|uniref:BQ5605_C001g00220 protein n=1 Tax=Microbotryum silenes-dioicae TaxID=796604 RepID=A0A2X0M2M7_9BASI|nr:BQ5605_C001g00220 [Microbotryum silenes-dioicae]